MLKNFRKNHANLFESKASNATASDTDRGQDLTSILDRSQRADLTLLVSDAAELMRNGILEAFEKQDDKSPSRSTSDQSSTPPNDNNGDTQSPPESPGNPAVEKREDSESIPQKEESQTVPQREEDFQNVPGRKALKKQARLQQAKANALSHFDDWRDSVLLRLGEIVNRGRDDENAEKQHAHTAAQSDDVPLDEDQRRVEKLRDVYRPVETSLLQLPKATRLLILHSLLLLLLGLEQYSSYSRVLLLHIAASLDIDINVLDEDEVKVARGLLDTALALSSNPQAQQQVKRDDSRKWKVGLASVAGAALIGVTGGLAAPLVAAGIGTIMGGLGLGATAAAGLLGTLASSGVVVGGLFGAYGGRMTGKMMDKYAREVDDFAFIPIRGSRQRTETETEAARQDHRLRVTIGVTGWVKKESNFIVPWRVIGDNSEVFALRWEMEPLMKLGNAISALVTSAAWSVAGKEILSRTIFASVMTAVMLPLGLLKVASVVDNPFSVAKARADKAGEVLADALINKVQGERPVTLIGYSLGSRLIFSCLQSLEKRGAYGLVESVILMGSPTPSTADHWRRMRSVVSGRLVNVFSQNDSVLAFLYRTSSLQLGIAGLQKVEGVPGVENLDASELISGHLRYQYLLGKIVSLVALQDVDAKEIGREEEALAVEVRRQEEERLRNEEKAGVKDKDSSVAQEALNSHDGLGGEDARTQEEVVAQTQENMTQHRIQMLDLDADDDYSEPLVEDSSKHSAI